MTALPSVNIIDIDTFAKCDFFLLLVNNNNFFFLCYILCGKQSNKIANDTKM